MDPKKLIWIWVFVGSSIGSYIPALWGASFLSGSSIFLGGVGAFVGLWVGFKITH